MARREGPTNVLAVVGIGALGKVLRGLTVLVEKGTEVSDVCLGDFGSQVDESPRDHVRAKCPLQVFWKIG